jgi:hypothetical protein
MNIPITEQQVRGELKRLPLLLLGTLLAGFSFAVFLAPFNLAAGGMMGVSLIINEYTGCGHVVFDPERAAAGAGLQTVGALALCVAHDAGGALVFPLHGPLYVADAPGADPLAADG